MDANTFLKDLRNQIDELANFIMKEISGEPSQNEGAVECSIRIMKEQKKEIKRLRKIFRDYCRQCGKGGHDPKDKICHKCFVSRGARPGKWE